MQALDPARSSPKLHRPLFRPAPSPSPLPLLPNPARLGLILSVVAIYAASIAIVGSAFQPRTGFPLDDSWIHQTVARNFAASGSLGYFPHQLSSGSTSLLWTLILSLNYTLLPHLNPVAFCLIINTACLLTIGLLLLRLALADGFHPLVALLWSAAPALDGNFIWLAFTGMEHLLFVALSLAFLSLWLASSSPHRRRTTVAAGLVLGALVMVRPEGLVLGALLLAPFWWPHRRLSDSVLAASVAAPLALCPFVVNLLTSHALLPVTFKGRRWMYSVHNGTPLTLRVQTLEQWVIRLYKTVTPLDGTELSAHGRYALDALTLLVLLLCSLALWSLVRNRRWRTALVCAWAAVHSSLYLLLLPTSGHGGRYQPFLLLLFFPLLALGISVLANRLADRLPDRLPDRLSDRLTPRPSPPALLAPALFLLLLASFSLPLWRRTLASDVAHIEDSHGVMAAYLRGTLPRTTIAVFDIGRIGYDRVPYLADLGGLTDKTYLDYLLTDRVAEYLRKRALVYIVLPSDGFTSAIGQHLGLEDRPDLTLTRLHIDCTPTAIWRLAWIQTKSADRCQELDRITYH